MPVPRAFKRIKILGRHVVGGTNRNASMTTALAGANNDLVYTSKGKGTTHNSIRVRYVVSGASTPLSVTNAGNDITVNVATDAGSAATSTANQVAAAVAAHPGASSYVTVANAAGNDGTGVVAAMGFTNLTGGTDWTRGG